MNRAVSRQPRRLRARRLRVEELNLGPIRASARHAGLGGIRAEVEDLSLHGMALVIPDAAAQHQLVLAGDRLDELAVDCDGGSLYQGSATVRRVAERDRALVLGIEFDSAGIDLGELYRRGARKSFAERWRVFHDEERHADISAEFKSWVVDLRAYLERARDFLAAEEKALEAEDLVTRQQALQQYLDAFSPDLIVHMNAAREQLNVLVQNLNDEQHSDHRAYFRAQVLPLLHASPVLRRCNEKPLGHPGDYEMMNMLYRSAAEGETLFGRALTLYASQEAASRAVVNRASHLAVQIRKSAESAAGSRLRVASIGCGPGREIGLVLESWPQIGARLDVALIDQELRAVSYCERTLAPLATRTGARLQFIREPVRHLLMMQRLSAALGERDLIYSAGLFDYFTDRSFGALLAALYEALIERGLLVIGNFSPHNSSRWMMEYYCDWFLTHRTAENLTRLAAALKPAPSSVVVEAEPLGVNLFLMVRR
ncbi:MAG TPA: hypothetical protein VKN99_23705 [Polyangia bacterium]|nr:hypothetical protein [Polyangia bacterium]